MHKLHSWQSWLLLLLSPSLPRSPSAQPLCKAPKLSNDVFSFTWLGLDYLPGSPCRPIKHLPSHGRRLTGSAFIMVINSRAENEWWNNPIQRDLKMPFTKGGHIWIAGNFTFHSAKSGLIEYERTGRRELECDSFTFHPHREKAVISFKSVQSFSCITHRPAAGSIIRDNMFLKAFLFTWPDNRIPHSLQVL